MRAEAIARALGGRKSGSGWVACCPAHHDRDPSLSLRDSPDGTVLVHCHAGCKQDDVITVLRSCGLWAHHADRRLKHMARAAPEPRSEDKGVAQDEMRRSEAAARLWRTALPAQGTAVEDYLRSRGITVPIPGSLRFRPRLKHPSGSVWPGMVALVTRDIDGQAVAVHRTFLAPDGSGKAPVDPQKMMLGPCRGGAVRLAAAAEQLLVGEGIETCLAAMQATGSPVWAALSTPGLRTLDLPPEVREVTILADGDDPGEEAARCAALRWAREGRRARIARPPRGLDFNDVLLGGAPHDDGGTPC